MYTNLLNSQATLGYLLKGLLRKYLQQFGAIALVGCDRNV